MPTSNVRDTRNSPGADVLAQLNALLSYHSPSPLAQPPSPSLSVRTNHSDSSPTPYTFISHNMPSRSPPTIDEVNNVRRMCRALLRYGEDNLTTPETFTVWTDGIMEQISVLASQEDDDTNIDMDVKEFNLVKHLTFIPNIMDFIRPYFNKQSNFRLPTLLDHI